MSHADMTGTLRWLFLALVIACTVSSAVLFFEWHQQAGQICHVAHSDNETLRSLLKLAQKNSRVSLRSDPARLHASQAFYRDAFQQLKTVDCGKL